MQKFEAKVVVPESLKERHRNGESIVEIQGQKCCLEWWISRTGEEVCRYDWQKKWQFKTHGGDKVPDFFVEGWVELQDQPDHRPA